MVVAAGVTIDRIGGNLMYPRNASSPDPVAIGAVVAIADGSVATSGVTVRVKPVGAAEGDGAGTTAYSTDGIVEYTPTQAETNYTSFILIAKKTGCIPVSVTVVTTASSTSGYAGVDWGHVNAPTASVSLSGTTVGTVTTVTNQLTAAAIATGVWQDTTSGDFTVAGSIGKSLFTSGNAPGAASGLAIVGSNMGTVSIATNGITSLSFQTDSITSTAIKSNAIDKIAAGVWQDVTAGDFTVANSVGKSVMNGVSLGTGLTVASVSGAVGSVTSGVTVTTNNDKTGYSLTQSFPTNFSSLSIDASGRVDLGKILGTASAGAVGYVGIDWGHVNAPTTSVNLSSTTISTSQAVASVTGAAGSVTGAVGSVTGNVGGNVSGSVGSVASGGITRSSFAADTGLQTVRSSTAQAGGSTTITLDASASATNSYYNNCLCFITGGTGVGQARFVTGYVGSTKVATVNSSWATTPDNTSTFAVIAFDAVPGATAPTAAQVATAVWQDTTSGDFTVSGSIGKSVLNGVSLGTGLTIAAVSGAVGSVTSGVTVTTNNDKTGYSLSQSFPTNFSSLAITAGGIVQADLQTIKTQAVTCAGGVTVGAYVGNATHALTVDSSGNVTVAGYAANEDPATLVLGATASSWDTAGTIGNKINGAASAGDPWTTSLPGGYTSGQAGAILGANLDAAVSTRLATSGYTAPDNADITAIKAKTDNLPSSPAATGGAMTLDTTQVVPLANVTGDTTVTVGHALLAARAQAAGAWSISGTTLTLKNPDGTTFRTFTLDSDTVPTART